jgi:hypothetical protein
MNERNHLFAWLEACPFDWDIITDDPGVLRVLFFYEEADEGVEQKED